VREREAKSIIEHDSIIFENKFWKKALYHKLKICEGELKVDVGFIVETGCKSVDLDGVLSYYIDKYSDTLIQNRRMLLSNSWTISIHVDEDYTRILLETFAQFVYHRDLIKLVNMIGEDYLYMTTYKDEDGLRVTKYKFILEGPIDFNRFQLDNQLLEAVELGE